MEKLQKRAAARVFSEETEHQPYGYTSLLGFKSSSLEELIKRVEKGFSYKTFETFRERVGLSTEDLVRLVHITSRTLARRRESGRLESDESDRLLRAARVLGRAIGLFEGDVSAARDWMQSPVLALGNKQPLELCSTEIGAQEVENLIGRLEHGVYS